MSWHKRRLPTDDPQPVKVEIDNIELEINRLNGEVSMMDAQGKRINALEWCKTMNEKLLNELKQ